MEIWLHFLTDAGYSKQQNYISCEAADIFHILVEGLISLVLIYCVRVQPLISYFSYMHYHIIVLHSCVVLTVFDLLERCVSLVLRLAI